MLAIIGHAIGLRLAYLPFPTLCLLLILNTSNASGARRARRL
ncbi:MAG TPA: hypothetical protein VMU39_25580 [Solirubrobacteraceae bacterium]|nr:hypothetical protein [Solirubrobacteraceae bacterium]